MIKSKIRNLEFTSLHELTLFCFSSFNSSSPQCSSLLSPPLVRLIYHSPLPCMASPVSFTPLLLLTVVKIYQKHECSQKLQGAERKVILNIHVYVGILSIPKLFILIGCIKSILLWWIQWQTKLKESVWVEIVERVLLHDKVTREHRVL